MSDARMTFEETCRELGVSEAELEQLVAAGEIASIKEGDTLYFKSDVVEKYKESKSGEDTLLLADDEILLEDDAAEEIDLLAMDDDSAPTTPVAGRPSEGALGESDELSLDDDELLDIDLDLDADLASDSSEVETADVSASDDVDETLLNMDGLLEEEAETTTPIVSAGDDDLLGGDLGEDTLLDTELDFGDETDTFEVDAVDDLTSDVTEEGTLLRGGGARVMQMKRKENNAWTTAVLALSVVVLLLPLAVTTNTVYFSSHDSARVSAQDSWVSDYNFLGGLVSGIADLLKSK